MIHSLEAIKQFFEKILPNIVYQSILSDRYLHANFSKALWLDRVPDLSIATSLTTLLERYKGVVMAIGQICIEQTEGLRDRFFIPVNQALWYYEQGATLEFDFIERFFPGIQKLIAMIREVLQLPNGAFGKAIGYFSPHSGGFPAHFDAYYNFIFQMDGTKTWLLHPNNHVKDPVQHYDLHEYPYLPSELKTYWQHRDTPPGDLAQIGIVERLIPGSMLYLPRGYWHQTEASELSVSLNITFSFPTILDIFLAALRKKMIATSINRKAPLHLGSTDYEYYLYHTSQLFKKITLEDLLEQLHQKQDSYQQSNKAFHALLEYCNYECYER